MKRKKLFALGLVLLLTFTFVAPTFAETRNFNNISFNGRAYHSFKTSSVVKSTNSNWTNCSCTITSVTYTFPDYNSCQARPITGDGYALADYQEIESGHSGFFTANQPDNSTSNKARFQIKNMDPNHDNEMHAIGVANISHN